MIQNQIRGGRRSFESKTPLSNEAVFLFRTLKAGNFALFQKALVLSLSTYLEHSLCTDYNGALFTEFRSQT
ncbi:hypothetical protein H058_01710 [Vibrio antiquarius]|nr:hypothetical protein H058_01710 [Vibrio antiquarius]